MHCIVVKKPDGGVIITHPAPEMFDPNSRTIRLMELHNEYFDSVKKVLDSFAPRLDEIRAHYKVHYSLIAVDDPRKKEKEAELFDKETAELECLDFELREFQRDRCTHKDFSLTKFVEEVWAYIVKRNGWIEGQYRIADTSCLPADRMYRNAWTDDLPTKTVDVDMKKARDIHRDYMRVARRDRLVELDAESQAADRAADAVKKKAVDAKKQQLLDVTKHPAIEAAQTPEQLKQVWPDFLGPRVTNE